VLLYELLAGEMPFEQTRLRHADWTEAVRIIREEDPPSLTGRLVRRRVASSTASSGEREAPVARLSEIASRRGTDERSLLRDLQGELEWIALRALEKEPDRRYAAASELSADIRRHLANEPVLARAPSTVYRVRKFVRRHRVGVAAAALVLLAIVGGGIAATIGFTKAVQAQREARREADSARRVSDFLVEMFRTSSPDRSRGETVTARTILEEGTRRIKSSLKDDPYIRARLLSTLGQVHQNLGMSDEGLALLREGVAVAESAGTRDEHDELELGVRLYSLALGLRYRNPEEVSAPLDRAISIAQASGDAGENLLIRCLGLKASWYNDRGQRAVADSVAALSIGMIEAAAQPDSQVLIRMIQLRGNYAHNDTRLAEAESLYLRALALADKTDREPSSSVFLNENLAALYRAMENPEKSMEHAERGLAIARRVFEPNHPTLAWSLRGYSDAFYARGDYEQAAAVREQALAIYRSGSGTARAVATQLSFLGAIYREMGKHDRAIACAEEACALNEGGIGSEAELGEALSNLGDAYREARRWGSADSTYRAAITVLDRVDPNGWVAALAYRGYGSVCRDTERFAEAESLYRHAEAKLDSTKEGLRRLHGQCLGDHAFLRSLQGRHEETETMLRRSQELMTGSVGVDAYEMKSMYVTWARARMRAGNEKGAIEALELALPWRATATDVNRFTELAALQSRDDFPRELRSQ
jgi:tetratricopeptide (TPR) repeat protein